VLVVRFLVIQLLLGLLRTFSVPLSPFLPLFLSLFAVLSEFAFKVKSIEIKLIEKMFSEFLAFAFIFVLPWTGTFIFINNHFKINISVSMGQAAVHCTVRINCGR